MGRKGGTEVPIEDLVEPDNRGPWRESEKAGFARMPYRLRNGKVIWLTFRQRLFVSEYLKDLNSAAAAIRAGYSERAVHHGGRANPITSRVIQEALAAEIEYRAAVADMTTDRIISGYAAIARGDIGKIIEWDEEGNITFKASKDIHVDDRSAIAEIKKDKKGAFTVRMHDPTKALDSLAKHYGMFREHNKREVTVTHEQLVLSSFKPLPQLANPDNIVEADIAVIQTQPQKIGVLVDEGDDE